MIILPSDLSGRYTLPSSEHHSARITGLFLAKQANLNCAARKTGTFLAVTQQNQPFVLKTGLFKDGRRNRMK